MTQTPARTGLQLRTLVKPSGELEMSLASVAVLSPAADEVVIRIEATPINPSDIGLLLGAADIASAKLSGSASSPVVTMSIAERSMKAMASRLGQSLPAGNDSNNANRRRCQSIPAAPARPIFTAAGGTAEPPKSASMRSNRLRIDPATDSSAASPPSSPQAIVHGRRVPTTRATAAIASGSAAPSGP